jgi:hypothetical protein
MAKRSNQITISVEESLELALRAEGEAKRLSLSAYVREVLEQRGNGRPEPSRSGSRPVGEREPAPTSSTISAAAPAPQVVVTGSPGSGPLRPAQRDASEDLQRRSETVAKLAAKHNLKTGADAPLSKKKQVRGFGKSH